MPEANQKGFIDRESQVRQIALRVTTALSVLVASLLFFLIVPFFPREIMVLLSIGLGALAYKAPTPALMLLLLLTLPGYFFQLDSVLPTRIGIPISLVVILFVTLLIVWVISSERGEPLGAIAGAISAVLMLTPFYYLALPIIIGIALFRTKGLKTRAASAILTFVVLYFPILAINIGTSTGVSVPIFERVSFPTQAPIPIMSLNEVLTHLSQVVDISNNFNSFPYLAVLADYWPLSPNQRLIPVGILFFIFTGAAIAVTWATLYLFRWLEKREVGHKYLPYAAKALSLLTGVLAFVLLASILAEPLNIINTLSLPALLTGTVIVGALWTLAEVWLRGRDYVLHMRRQLTDRARDMRTQTDFLSNRLVQTKSTCQRIDTSEEEALGLICDQELSFTEQTVNEMPLNDMEKKSALFQELHSKLDVAIQGTQDKLCHYFDEERRKYNDSLMRAQNFGFLLGNSLQGPDFSQLMTMNYDEVLKLQAGLNDLYKSAAFTLAEGIEKLVATISSEVDPEFKRTGIHIARNYFERECYAEALQEFLLELGEIEHLLLDSLANLDKEVLDTSGGLKTAVADVLLPTAVNMGDVNSVNHYHEMIIKITGLCGTAVENATLPDRMRTVGKVSELGEIIAELGSRLGEKLLELEKSIQDKTPSGYSWGVDTNIRNRMAEISLTFRKPSGPVDIFDRLSLLKTGPSAVNSASQAIKEYSVAHELLINYANLECLIEEKLSEEGSVSLDDLPVKRQYSRHYLKLYSLKHPGEVYVEADTGRLTNSPTPTPRSRRSLLKGEVK